MNNMLVAVAAIAVSVTACGKSEVQVPRTLRDLDSSIFAVQETSAELRITLNAQAVLRVKDVMQNASMRAARISEQLLRYFPDVPQERVIYVVVAGLEDKYGKTSLEPVLEIRFSMAELRKVDFKNMYHKKLLNLADTVSGMTAAGEEAVSEWCADQDNRQAAPLFCKLNMR